MFVVNMTFISSSEVKKMYISWVPKARMNYTFFHFTKNVYFMSAEGTNEIYIFSLHEMK